MGTHREKRERGVFGEKTRLYEIVQAVDGSGRGCRATWMIRARTVNHRGGGEGPGGQRTEEIGIDGGPTLLTLCAEERKPGMTWEKRDTGRIPSGGRAV